MAKIVKRLSAPFEVKSTDSSTPTSVTFGELGPNNAEITINGNLIVLGTHTSVESTDVFINDAIITLNSSLAANTAPLSLLRSGIEVNRGSLSNSTLQWNEATLRWEIKFPDGIQGNVAIETNGGYITALVDDHDPHLGGNLNTNGFAITSNLNLPLSPPVGFNVVISAPIQFTEVAPPSSPVVSNTLLYAGIPKAGNAGLYVTNSKSNNEELITKRKAIIFSIII